MNVNELAEAEEEVKDAKQLESAFLELPYIPDFLLEETLFWFAPTREGADAVYLELTGDAAETWKSSYTKKGWSFIHDDPRPAEGPYRVAGPSIRLSILEPGRIFAPKPVLRLAEGGQAIPIVSLEKRRPLNPWKPNYIQALNFIKKYEWPHSLPRSVQHAIWEIEECGQIAGSVSWKNAELILRDFDTKELRLTLADIFFNRPEDYPLGSEVYLRTLGRSGPNGFAELVELAKHPISRKRKVVAHTLGELRKPEGVAPLLVLLEDEDPDVRNAALRALGKTGVRPGEDPSGKVIAYLGDPEVPKRVWAAQSLLKGGDIAHEKFLLTLVKEEPRLLTDMGELGDVLGDLGLFDAVPYLIHRLKSDKAEFRADAAEALGKVTGVELEYHSVDTEEQRKSAIKTYTRWWEDRKREKRSKV
jgi:hypothetical protein